VSRGGGRRHGETDAAARLDAAMRREQARRAEVFRRWPLVVAAVAGGVAALAVLGFVVWLGERSAPSAPEVTNSIDAVPAPGRALPTVSSEGAQTVDRPEREGLVDTACWFPVSVGRQARCGVLTVPERWNAAPSRVLHLRFVVFRGAANGHADPIIYVSGGPGVAAQIDAASVGRWWNWIDRTNWLRDRDLVVFDPRGVGLSEPRMDCPELAEAAYRVFVEPLTREQTIETWDSAARRCRDRLQDLGIDLTSYNTEFTIADLHSLITELGYRAWNLLAISYGTRVALGFTERWPVGTRAVVLDSVYPVNVAAYVDGGSAAAGAFTALFRECDSDRLCHASFPDLAKAFQNLVRRAAVTPIPITIADPRGGSPLHGALDDSKLIDVLLHAFYDWRGIAQLPTDITALADGDGQAVEELAHLALSDYMSESLSHGLFLSVECQDEFPFNPSDDVDRAAAKLPLYRNFMLSNLPLVVCPSWPVGAMTHLERHPVTGDVPVLMLSGELDPLTPPQWAKLASASLRNALQIEFRGIGHGVLDAHACPGVIVGRFLDDPTRSPIDDCLLAMGPPHFQTASSGR
jgi:pimeloyl-ACP methyl ester carboxylesterase